MIFIGATQNIRIPHGRPSLLYDHTNVIMMVVVYEGFYCNNNIKFIMRNYIEVLKALSTTNAYKT